MELLRERGVEFDIIEYLKTPPAREALEEILAMLEGPAADLVRKDKRFSELGLKGEDYVDQKQIVALLLEHPELMQRPIVITRQPRDHRAARGKADGVALTECLACIQIACDNRLRWCPDELNHEIINSRSNRDSESDSHRAAMEARHDFRHRRDEGRPPPKAKEEIQAGRKTATWDDLIGIAKYNGPRRSIREMDEGVMDEARNTSDCHRHECLVRIVVYDDEDQVSRASALMQRRIEFSFRKQFFWNSAGSLRVPVWIRA